MEIFVLNDKFEVQAEIDNYTSLIWCRRAHDVGAVDLEIEASAENVELFQIGYFIYRKDTNDICRIDAIEVKTDPEEGDSLIIGATDLKSLANQVSVIGEYKTEITQSGESNIVVKNDVKVEEWIREAMKVFTPYDSSILPKSIYKQFVIDNFSLYDLKGYEDMCTLSEGKDLKLSEHINYLCKMSGMRWGITYDYDNRSLKLNLEKGLDKTVNQKENTRVLFSQTFDNLQSTKLSQAIDKMANVAAVYHNNASIVGDNGVIFSYLTREEPYGLYRFELPVDGTKVEIPHLQTSADFVEVAEGEGDYKKNDDGTFTKGKGNYNYIPRYTIDEIKSYAEILRGLGLTKLRESRVTQKFESEINFNQFVYRDDYDVGDTVTVQNDYGIQLDAKITEIVETWDETGYSIEPVFEFIGEGGNFGGFAGFGNFENTEGDWDLTDCLITEKGEPMMTETDDCYLMYEDAISVIATEAGIALTNEEGTILSPTTTFRMTRSSGSEPVTTALYDVSTTETAEIETVKISELPEANSIGDACCLPIVQDGETKKIYFDKIKENIGIDEDAVQTIVNSSIAEVVANAPEDLDTLKEMSDWISEHKEDASAMNSAILENKANLKNKANYNLTTMVDLGFTRDSYVSVRDFWSELYSNFGSNGVVQFEYNFAESAYVGNSNNNVSIIGGTLIYTASGSPNNWRGFSAVFFDNGYQGIYHIRCNIGDDITVGNETWIIQRLADASHNHDGRYYTEAEIDSKLSSHTHSNKANYKKTTMVGLGFARDTWVHLTNFWKQLYDKVGSNGVVDFDWNFAESAILSDDKMGLTIAGGTLTYTCKSFNTWSYFTGMFLVHGNQELYKIYAFVQDDTSKPTLSITRIADMTSVNQLNNGILNGVLKSNAVNVMGSNSSIDFNTNKATLQLPIYSADATNQPTAQGAMWLQEVKESE